MAEILIAGLFRRALRGDAAAQQAKKTVPERP